MVFESGLLPIRPQKYKKYFTLFFAFPIDFQLTKFYYVFEQHFGHQFLLSFKILQPLQACYVDNVTHLYYDKSTKHHRRN
jgi:hypothetical protein